MRAIVRATLTALVAIPLSVAAFIVVAGWMILREPDGSPFLDGDE